MAESARETISRAGVRTPISDEDLAEILERASLATSQASSSSHLSETTPRSHKSYISSSPGNSSTVIEGSNYYGTSVEDLSLPAEVLSELASPRFPIKLTKPHSLLQTTTTTTTHSRTQPSTTVDNPLTINS